MTIDKAITEPLDATADDLAGIIIHNANQIAATLSANAIYNVDLNVLRSTLFKMDDNVQRIQKIIAKLVEQAKSAESAKAN